MSVTTDTCKTCVKWAPMLLKDSFLGVCAVTKQCTDRLETCEHYDSGNVVAGHKIEEYLS